VIFFKPCAFVLKSCGLAAVSCLAGAIARVAVTLMVEAFYFTPGFAGFAGGPAFSLEAGQTVACFPAPFPLSSIFV
jgi:hypothetical protein